MFVLGFAGESEDIATLVFIGIDQAVPKNGFAFTSPEHLPVLSKLLSLRLSGYLQIWCHQRRLDGSLASFPL